MSKDIILGDGIKIVPGASLNQVTNREDIVREALKTYTNPGGSYHQHKRRPVATETIIISEKGVVVKKI